MSSSPDSESEECTNLTLMASHHYDNEEVKVSNEQLSYDNDAQEEIKNYSTNVKFYAK